MKAGMGTRGSDESSQGRWSGGLTFAGTWLNRVLARLLAYRDDVDGRIFVAGALCVYFLVVSLPRLIWGADIWPWLGVPSGPSLFFDTRNVTAALDCRRLGYDPLMESPCDPWGRPMNYPRIWLALRWLGLNQSHTDILALAFILLFFTAVFFVVGRISLGGGILLTVALWSPSVMFAIERANMDIVVFAVMALAVILWRTGGPLATTLSPVVVLAAAAGKIYPVFGLLAYFFTRHRRAALAAILCGGLFAIYAAVSLGDIAAVARTAPQGDHHSFGARILLASLYHQFVPERWQGGAITKQLIAVAPLLVGATLLWWWRRHHTPRDESRAETPASANLLAFFMGSLVYLGTFAVGNNFDYRLVFLLLTLPQLFEWIRAGRLDRRSTLSAAVLVAILVLLWIGALSEPLRLWDELASWGTAVLLVAALSASVPEVKTLWATLTGSLDAERSTMTRS
jgi:hypothetical protein